MENKNGLEDNISKIINEYPAFAFSITVWIRSKAFRYFK
jgi:hypothetical protein